MFSIGIFLGIGEFSFMHGYGNRFFVEGDPTLSYPYIEDADVSCPIWLLMVAGLAIPVVIIVGSHLVLFGRTPVGSVVHHRLLITGLYFLMAFLIAILVTQAIKHYEGRLRPDFYAMCNYKNYRTAINNCERGTGTWWTCAEGYGYVIEKGAPGNLIHCLSSESDIHEARSSYPSGHSSMPAATFGFLAFFFYYAFTGPEVWHSVLKVLLPAASVWGAIMIAATRPRDYWHNFSDINSGLAIGFTSALVCGYRWSLDMVNLEKKPLNNAQESAKPSAADADHVPLEVVQPAADHAAAVGLRAQVQHTSSNQSQAGRVSTNEGVVPTVSVIG